MKRIFLASLLTVIFSSCARVQTLNLKPHTYSERPNHIVWIQVAGLSEEHIPLLRFNVSEATHKTSLEQVDCIGKMWNFNLYQLRPEASMSFTSQANGSKNIQGSCSDFEMESAWNFLDKIQYESAFLENGASDAQTVERALACPNNKTFDISKMRLYRMGPNVKENQSTFHYQDSPEQAKDSSRPGMYYDRSCQKGICFSSLSNNFKTLWDRLAKDRRKTFFVVRDFNFQKALKKKDLSYARESLLEIDRMVASLANEKPGDLLVIVSGAESLPVEFPLQGKEWAEFEKTGKNIIYKNISLMSPVLARGAMAENFCGIFDESEMLKRVIFKPESRKFNWEAVTPF